MKHRYILLNIRGKLVRDGVHYKENMPCYSNMMSKYKESIIRDLLSSKRFVVKVASKRANQPPDMLTKIMCKGELTLRKEETKV